MAEKFERVARPYSSPETPGVTTPRGINRNHLTLYLSVGAALLSVAGGGVQLITWFDGHKQQLAAQAALDRAQKELVEIQKIKESALARAAQLEAALKEQQIKTGAAQQEEAVAAAVSHMAAARNNDQDTAKKRGETVSAEARGYLDNEVIRKSGVVPLLANSVRGAASGGDPLGVPAMNPSSLPPPVARTFTSQARRDDPLANPSSAAADLKNPGQIK